MTKFPICNLIVGSRCNCFADMGRMVEEIGLMFPNDAFENELQAFLAIRKQKDIKG